MTLPAGWDIPPLEPRLSHADLLNVLRENPEALAAMVPENKAELIAFVLDYATFSSPRAAQSVFEAIDRLIPDDGTPA